jgi:hypothetical protein
MSVFLQLAPCCRCVVMACWLFFNFAVLFDFGCCSLAQEMSFVDCYLIYFRAYHPPTVSPSAFPAFDYWKFTQRPAPCPSCLLHCSYSTLPRLLCVSFQFIVYSVCCFVFVFVFQGRGRSAHGAMLVYFRGGWGNTMWCLVLTCLVCWMSHSMFGTCVWWQCYMLSVTWHGEVLYGLGVPGVEVWGEGLAALGFELRASFLLARCWSFYSFLCFISSKCDYRISATFFIYRAHTVCFCILVTILKPPRRTSS